MSFKPIESEVRKALGIMSGRIKGFIVDGKPSQVDDDDRKDAEDYILAILKDGWNV